MKQSLDSEPELIPGDNGVFDVVVEGELVYSKSKTGIFPDEDRLIRKLVSVYGKK